MMLDQCFLFFNEYLEHRFQTAPDIVTSQKYDAASGGHYAIVSFCKAIDT